ncbi:O-methyltransferase [Alkalibacterium kapii]|uniref:tRNA 5-hydroxyuridine methyltransferase n=1 Tax=Alkalibacterium kapii TaxID=426704 RepID=A0A511AVA5_9LACT|nr:O-methyltransferase [Alkalibacterium kapii]GEK92084.1 O-methyltransferase [Alkalibacterium kapii]
MIKRNEMMDRPVIDKDVREFLRSSQKQLSGELGRIERWANERRVPVIPHETVTFFNWLLPILKPKKILEVGTAIGFSAGLMLKATDSDSHVTTIERNPDMIEKAKSNFQKLGVSDQVTLLEGQASEWLEKIEKESIDFIFMDSAKAKYYDFFPHCYRVLKHGGVIAIDDVLQGGTILDDSKDVPRRRRKIHKKLNAFLKVVLDHPALDSSIVPLGDGLLLITKRESFDFGFMLPEEIK